MICNRKALQHSVLWLSPVCADSRELRLTFSCRSSPGGSPRLGGRPRQRSANHGPKHVRGRGVEQETH
eukprot:7932353-Pyramimonas_sp.AAC.1